jgi:D-alanyl-D-alanine carboxypeptidase
VVCAARKSLVLGEGAGILKVSGYDKGTPVMIDVVPIDSFLHYLQKEAAEAFLKMRDAAEDNGITLKVNSAWRSNGHQQKLQDLYEKRLEEWARRNEPRGQRPLRPARPGWSKHQMGLAVDIGRSHDDPDGSGPKKGPTDIWLEANAHKYGFKKTVPKELWHWEWVGTIEEE